MIGYQINSVKKTFVTKYLINNYKFVLNISVLRRRINQIRCINQIYTGVLEQSLFILLYNQQKELLYENHSDTSLLQHEFQILFRVLPF